MNEGYWIHYGFELLNHLRDITYSRYVKHHTVRIGAENSENEVSIIGEVKFDVALMETFYLENSSPFHEAFPEAPDFYLTDVPKIMDFDKNDFSDKVHQKAKGWEDPFFSDNFCYIHSYWITPEFRGQQLFIRTIKNIVHTYPSLFGLLIIEPTPFQKRNDVDEEILKKIKPETFVKNKVVAMKRLSKYLENSGFSKLKGLGRLYFHSPEFKNVLFDEIEE